MTTSLNELLVGHALEVDDLDYATELANPTQTLDKRIEDIKLLSGHGADASIDAGRAAAEIKDQILNQESAGQPVDQRLYTELAAMEEIAGELY